MNAAIISIGNELLNGKTINTNATFIGRQLYDIGIVTTLVLTIRDEEPAIRDALDRALGAGEVAIITGGLGPTHDDITKSVISDYFNAELVLNKDILEHVKARFETRGVPMPAINREQAMVPANARPLHNPLGTAPGMHFEEDGKHIFVCPGVPREMKGMVAEDIIPFLRNRAIVSPIDVHLYRTTGISESKLYEICRPLFESRPSYEIAFLPKFTNVEIRVAIQQGASFDSDSFADFEAELYSHIGEFIYAKGDAELEVAVGEMLSKKNLSLAVAESFTGGMLQDKLTNVPGSSDYYLGGIIAYSNQSKVQYLGVREESLNMHGSVSEAVAMQMAAGVRKLFDADIGISTTGIAGPGGATAEKPVGLSFVGVATPTSVYAVKYQLGSTRVINKERGCQRAMDVLRRNLSQSKSDDLAT